MTAIKMGNETIATEHKDVRIVPETELQAHIIVPVCATCEHPICPGCMDWCDRQNGEGDLCCDGHCVLGTTMAAVLAASARPELLEQWQAAAQNMRERAAGGV